jgi:hypothetical protein
MNSAHEKIKTQLSSGEHVLWSGQPRQGVVVRGSDAFMIPFSLLWGGFAVFWEISVTNSNAPAFFALWGIPFVLIGVYMIVGRFFVEAKQRANTFYAVTDERVLIISGILKHNVKSLNLRTLSELSLTEGKGNEGTISFGADSSFSSIFRGFSNWPGMGAQLGPRFDLISNAKSVFETILCAQRAA